MEEEARGPPTYSTNQADPVRNGMWLSSEKRGCFSKLGSGATSGLFRG